MEDWYKEIKKRVKREKNLSKLEEEYYRDPPTRHLRGKWDTVERNRERMESRNSPKKVWKRQWIDKCLKVRMREANEREYAKFLEGYLKKGDEIGNYYDYNMHPEEIRYAKKDFKMKPLYGAKSVDVIVPEGVNVEVRREVVRRESLCGDGDYKEIRELGHCSLYFMKDFSYKGSKPDLYKDVFEILKERNEGDIR